MSNKKNKAFFAEKIKEIEKKNILDIKKIKEIEKNINDLKLEIRVKASENGKLFGSITNKHILQIFEKNNIFIKKNNVIIDNIINKIGNYEIIVDLKNNIKIKKTLSIIKE